MPKQSLSYTTNVTHCFLYDFSIQEKNNGKILPSLIQQNMGNFDSLSDEGTDEEVRWQDPGR